MKYTATLTLPDQNSSTYTVLSTEETMRDRSTLALRQTQDQLHIELNAKDFSAFKGSLYGILKLLDVHTKVNNL